MHTLIIDGRGGRDMGTDVSVHVFMREENAWDHWHVALAGATSLLFPKIFQNMLCITRPTSVRLRQRLRL